MEQPFFLTVTRNTLMPSGNLGWCMIITVMYLLLKI